MKTRREKDRGARQKEKKKERERDNTEFVTVTTKLRGYLRLYVAKVISTGAYAPVKVN